MRRLIGENVRQARLHRRLTQARFAEMCGFSQQYISDLENGARNPTAITLFEVAQALAVPVHELLMQHEAGDWPSSVQGD